MNENEASQKEELEALCAIYGTDWRTEVDDDSYSMQISREVQLFITLNSNYPSDKPPSYQLLAPTLSRNQKEQIYTEFNDIYKNNLGGPVLFEWIEKLKEIVENAAETKIVNADVQKEEKLVDNNESSAIRNLINNKIVHGKPIQDRKSTFQGHACSVETSQDVKDVMEVLLENKKAAQATHNILAYRICLQNGSILQDCDDDGETHAGGRLLHLLQILNATNVMVVVSRWYGGIHLGPDRFRHINNSARLVLQQGGFIKDKTG